ncbi:MAG: heme exporter protein CcmB [Anaerolineales bacterium]|nr:heme exporter protein CcmB [Anaerolineales bacterium]
MSGFWQAVTAVVRKDLTIERHTGQSISVMVVFALAVVVTFNLALGGDLDAARSVSVGLLWATILLAGTLGLNRSFAAEQENNSFDALLMGPVDRSAIFLGKVVSVSLLMFALELILIVVFTAFFNKPFYLPAAVLVLVLGTIGYVAAGVLVTSMAMQTRARAVLIPVLLLPLTLPVVLSAASAMATILDTAVLAWDEVGFSLSLVVLFDVLMLAVGLLTYQFVVED